MHFYLGLPIIFKFKDKDDKEAIPQIMDAFVK